MEFRWVETTGDIEPPTKFRELPAHEGPLHIYWRFHRVRFSSRFGSFRHPDLVRVSVWGRSPDGAICLLQQITYDPAYLVNEHAGKMFTVDRATEIAFTLKLQGAEGVAISAYLEAELHPAERPQL